MTGFIIAPIVWLLVGEGVSPPGPIPSQYAVIVVPTTFFLAIAFGGWPFTRLSRNMGVAGFLLLVTSYVLTYALFRVFFNYEFLQGAPVYLESAPTRHVQRRDRAGVLRDDAGRHVSDAALRSVAADLSRRR